jgi:hypothetical protein
MFVTVTVALPAEATTVAGTLTVICVAVMVAGVRTGFVPRVTVAPVMKLLPVIVMVNAPDPATRVVGVNDVTVGAGLFTVNGV